MLYLVHVFLCTAALDSCTYVASKRSRHEDVDSCGREIGQELAALPPPPDGYVIVYVCKLDVENERSV